MIFQNDLKINSEYVNNHRYYVSKVNVETSSGWINSKTTSQAGLKLESDQFKMLKRGISDVRINVFTTDGIPARIAYKPAFFQIRF